MRRPAFSLSDLGVIVLGLWLSCLTAVAQTTPHAAPPPFPTLKSPVDSFRALLVMPTAEQRQLLASRGTNVQARLVAKLNEYRRLTPEERELRLKATELRWYLQPLLRSAPTNRPAQLALVPETLRPLVATRLAQWDRIPPAVQQMFLSNNQAAVYLARVELPTNYPALPSAQIRQRLVERINQLFELTPDEKESVLATLSEAEQRQMRKTMEAFQQLTPQQRRQCLRSFKYFSELPPAEKQEFLNNAERWSRMTPAERQSWRELVSTAPRLPPLPFLPRPSPPLPILPGKPGAALTTNGG